MADISRIPAFYKLSVADRAKLLCDRGLISAADCNLLIEGRNVLKTEAADKMIENVVGVMGLPIGLALNFLINDQDWVIPMVVEEPSIVAGLSSAAKIARLTGGFKSEVTDPILIGQVQITSVPDLVAARQALSAQKQDIIHLANSLHPRMVERGGGVKDIELRTLESESMLILHLLVDTRDAMGANLVNTICEGVAPLAEQLTGGKVLLRILSNLTDRALVRARMQVPIEQLATRGYSGDQVCQGIVAASRFAAADPYRAATHNKGIMNGVDAVAIATGNDWRALEAAAHAYAARSGRYKSLSSFQADSKGNLIGTIEMPMKVGIVGGSLKSNPTVALNLRLLGVKSAVELASVIGCVGLAQNFAALRALATEGIQRGHMNLHARSVAMTAGVPADLFDTVVEQLIESGEIKVWKAKAIATEIQSQPAGPDKKLVATAETDKEVNIGEGSGKIILLGEHAVVYGRRALVAPITLAITAKVSSAKRSGAPQLNIPAWGIQQSLSGAIPPSIQEYDRLLKLIFEQLEVAGKGLLIEVFPDVPRAMGLGSSAALAVALIRAIGQYNHLSLSDEEVNDLAYKCEQITHGTPSGVDNTLATYGKFISFQRQERAAVMSPVQPAKPLPVVIGLTNTQGSTAVAVGKVRDAWKRNQRRYDLIFDQIDSLTGQGIDAIQRGDLEEMGELMNLCQGYLNALQVSGPEIEDLVQIARNAGALGAKLTGGGIGGSVIALCEQETSEVTQAIRDAGYKALQFNLE